MPQYVKDIVYGNRRKIKTIKSSEFPNPMIWFRLQVLSVLKPMISRVRLLLSTCLCRTSDNSSCNMKKPISQSILKSWWEDHDSGKKQRIKRCNFENMAF